MRTLVDPFAELPSVDLDELVRVASLQTRLDRKYIVSVDRLDDLLGIVGADARALEIEGRRRFGYVSTYLDTSEWACYRAAATCRPRRYKVRTRTYSDSGESWAEVKLRSNRGETVKHRLALARALDESSAPASHRVRAFATEVLGGLVRSGDEIDRLRPAITTRYERATLLVPGGRVTVDLDVRARAVDGGPSVCVPDHVIVETKSDVTATDVDHALRHLGVRPVAISKYAIGVAALRPDLPANRWHRVLDRYVRVDD